MVAHELTGPVHRLWTTSHEPALTVSDGDTITFSVQEALAGQFDGLATGDPLPEVDWDRVYPLAGPVLVAGAEPGDTLEIEVLEVAPTDWGWTAVVPGLGLLADDFPVSHFHRWDLSGAADGGSGSGGSGFGGADFKGLATVPVRPFLGVMGVCPDTVEPLPVLPPGHFGGNLDCRDLVAGARLYLPVQVPGGRLALGDPHAAQGDGEVCVSAIEASASGAVRVRLHKGRRLPGPQLRTPGPLRRGIDDAGYYATMGVGPDLMAAARDALRAMIDHLGTEYGLAPLDAYVLSSTCVDLKITEVVDAPNWVVSAYLPVGIMRG